MNSTVTAPASHTPGPWSLYPTRFPTGANGFTLCGNDARGNRNVPVAEIPEWLFSNLGTKENHAANARLIAAAPDLLASLKILCKRCEQVLQYPHAAPANGSLHERLQWLEVAEDKARAIIAKAEGQ